MVNFTFLYCLTYIMGLLWRFHPPPRLRSSSCLTSRHMVTPGPVLRSIGLTPFHEPLFVAIGEIWDEDFDPILLDWLRHKSARQINHTGINLGHGNIFFCLLSSAPLCDAKRRIHEALELQAGPDNRCDVCRAERSAGDTFFMDERQ